MSWPVTLNDELPELEFVPEIVSPIADDPVNPDCNKFATTIYEGTVASTPRPRRPRTMPSAD